MYNEARKLSVIVYKGDGSAVTVPWLRRPAS
jgi:hypothetical protein